MRLTREDHRDQLERFRHLRPVGRLGGKRCGASLPGSTRRCSRAREHRGPHAAHRPMGGLLAVWDDGGLETRPSQEARATPVKARRSRVPRKGRPSGLLEIAWERTVRVLSSPEELALLILFLGLVAFAVDVALRILAAW